jgi:hypothetical protein
MGEYIFYSKRDVTRQDILSKICCRIRENGSGKKSKRGSHRQETNRLHKEFMKEILLLSKLRHPNITFFMGAVLQKVMSKGHAQAQHCSIKVYTIFAI